MEKPPANDSMPPGAREGPDKEGVRGADEMGTLAAERHAAGVEGEGISAGERRVVGVDEDGVSALECRATVRETDGVSALEGGATGGVDVFISYNSKDHALVTEVAEGLAGLGLKPFLDRWDLAPGMRWRPELERVLASCRSVLVVIGPHGVGEVQEREVDVALRRQDKDRRFPVVPVLIPGSEAPSGMLATLTWVDIRHQATSEAVRDLALAIRKQWGREPSLQRAQTNRRRYLANLGLLTAALGVGAAWYLRHLHTRMEAVAFGGTVTLPALLWLAFLWLRWGAEDEVKSLPRRLFGSSQSTKGLSVALVSALVLWLGTSSVQVTRGALEGDEGSVRVTVESKEGKPLWQSPTLTPDKAVASRLFFFRFGEPIALRVEPSGDHGALEARLGPARRVTVRAPDQFPPREIRVVRLLPGGKLMRVLGKPGGDVARRFDLAVVAEGVTNRIPDLRKQAVYLAASAADVDMGRRRESATERLERYRGWAKIHLGLPEEQVAGFLGIWVESRTEAGVACPDRTEGMGFELYAENGGGAERLTALVLDGTNSVRTVLIDRMR